MYTPIAFAESDPGILIAFIEKNPFATVVTSAESGPVISHLPMYYREEGGKGILVGHLAKANDHCRFLGGKTTVIFHGPHAYVSSKWYETGNVVPTWNYIAVHVSGVLEKTEGAELGRILNLMLEKHEGDPRSFYLNMDDNVRSNLEKQIVGVKMAIGKMEGKWKLSQNKSRGIQEKVISRLWESGDWNSMRIAEMMRARLETENEPGG